MEKQENGFILAVSTELIERAVCFCEVETYLIWLFRYSEDFKNLKNYESKGHIGFFMKTVNEEIERTQKKLNVIEKWFRTKGISLIDIPKLINKE